MLSPRPSHEQTAERSPDDDHHEHDNQCRTRKPEQHNSLRNQTTTGPADSVTSPIRDLGKLPAAQTGAAHSHRLLVRAMVCAVRATSCHSRRHVGHTSPKNCSSQSLGSWPAPRSRATSSPTLPQVNRAEPHTLHLLLNNRDKATSPNPFTPSLRPTQRPQPDAAPSAAGTTRPDHAPTTDDAHCTSNCLDEPQRLPRTRAAAPSSPPPLSAREITPTLSPRRPDQPTEPHELAVHQRQGQRRHHRPIPTLGPDLRHRLPARRPP